jgi:hypothetical protein
MSPRIPVVTPGSSDRELLMQILQYSYENAKDINEALKKIAVVETKIEQFAKLDGEIDSNRREFTQYEITNNLRVSDVEKIIEGIKKDVGARATLISSIVGAITVAVAFLIAHFSKH